MTASSGKTPFPLGASGVTVGTGADKLVLTISEDRYASGGGTADANGDANFVVLVDGKQIGGTLTATAMHSLDQTQAFTVEGNFGTGNHMVEVQLTNDAWSGVASATTDRNIYINGVTYNGAAVSYTGEDLNGTGAWFTVSGGTASTGSTGGSASTGSGTLSTGQSPAGTIITAGSGSITDANGNVYTIAAVGGGITCVDDNGSAISGGLGTSVPASIVEGEYYNGSLYLQYPSGHWFTFSDSAGWVGPVTAPPASTSSTGASTGGTSTGSTGGTTSTGSTGGSTSGATTGGSTSGSGATSGVTVGTGADKLVLTISEDRYASGGGTADANGDANFVVLVDGKQIGGTLTATAMHSLGQTETFTVEGNFGTGNHMVEVQLTNDAWSGVASATTDRNIYINGVTYNGAAVSYTGEDLNGTGAWFTVSGGTASTGSTGGSTGSTGGSASTGSGTLSTGQSPAGTIITAGSGSITDATGNVYTIAAVGGGITCVDDNGSAISGGLGTSVPASIVEGEYYNGSLYLQYPSGHWFTFSDSAGWVGPVTAPPASTSSTGGSTSSTGSTGGTTTAGSTSGGPLTLLHAQGTQFVDANGNDVYLAGTHTWNQSQSFVNEPQFTFQQFSDFEKTSVDANFIRYWLNAEPNNGDGTFPDSQLPFVRSSNGQFDLTQYNQSFFDQLKSDVQIAAANGQYVDVILTTGIGWPGSGDPFTAANNVQGVGNGTPQDPALQSYEQAYIAKILDTIGTAPNVMYEIANEADYKTAQWQESMVDFVHSYEQQHGLRPQMAGITAFFPLSADASDINAALEGSNADWIEPSGYGFTNNPPTPASMGSKPVIVDDDHTGGVTNPGWAWQLLTTGNSMAYMDDMAGSGLADPVYATGIDSAGGSYTGGDATIRDAMRLAMQETREVASQLDLNGMTPQASLSTTGFALADAVKGEFVVFAPNGGQFSVNLAGASGTLNAEWVNVATGSFTSAGQVQGGANHTFTAPDASDGLMLHH